MYKFWSTLRAHQNNIIDNMTPDIGLKKNTWNWQENVRDTEIFYWYVLYINIYKYLNLWDGIIIESKKVYIIAVIITVSTSRWVKPMF